MKKFVTGLLAGGLLLAGSSVLAANDAETVNNEMKTEPVTAAAPSQAVLSKSRGTMVYVPMDTRPVCKDYTVATMQAAGWNIVVPPDELLSLTRDYLGKIAAVFPGSAALFVDRKGGATF